MCYVQRTLLLTIVLEIGFVIYFSKFNPYYTTILSGTEKDVITKVYNVNVTGCHIPYLNITDKDIIKLLRKVRNYSCGNKRPLIESNLTSLLINISTLSDYGIKDINHVHCTYKPFWRRPPNGTEDDIQVEYGTKTYFYSSINIFDEFIRVECAFNGQKYIDYHTFVPMKSTVDTKRQESDERLNVIIVGIDSLSRLHVRRKMPKMIQYLEQLNAIEFMGYNKVGENSFPNLIPLLTSYNTDELIQKCWSNVSTRFDNCSLLWTNYSKQGYIISFAEEQSAFGLFNYHKKGWLKQPTDYYWNTVDYIALNELEKRYIKDYPVCMGPRLMYKVMLDSAEKFITTLKRNKFFIFYWSTSLTHNHIDTPSLGDEDYANHLNYINKTGVLNKSLLILMSNHGYRFGKTAQTRQGHLEDRLPFIYWIFPDWFKTKYKSAMDNFNDNAFQLTTTFDIHETLNHILLVDALTDDKINSAKTSNTRGISLFHKIPDRRTCDTAGIPAHYCTCQEALPVKKSDQVVIEITAFTVQHLNNLLAPYNQCAALVLDQITSANLARLTNIYQNNNNVSDYTISFKTIPGGGWFDATIRCTTCHKHDFQLTGVVGRLNRYDNQSYCVSNLNLKLYCYCTT